MGKMLQRLKTSLPWLDSYGRARDAGEIVRAIGAFLWNHGLKIIGGGGAAWGAVKVGLEGFPPIAAYLAVLGAGLAGVWIAVGITSIPGRRRLKKLPKAVGAEVEEVEVLLRSSAEEALKHGRTILERLAKDLQAQTDDPAARYMGILIQYHFIERSFHQAHIALNRSLRGEPEPEPQPLHQRLGDLSYQYQGAVNWIDNAIGVLGDRRRLNIEAIWDRWRTADARFREDLRSLAAQHADLHKHAGAQALAHGTKPQALSLAPDIAVLPRPEPEGEDRGK